MKSLALIRWLCFCLFFVQTGANLHALSHAEEAFASASLIQHGGEMAQAPDHCGVCLAYAAMSAGMVPSVLPHLAPAPVSLISVIHIAADRAIATASYLSRAPPLSA